ncbi:hypothetical protein BSL78_09743 [Apostichopus japonicus]|uniref:Uncharacterized protein n=1 Tax=Stichopus japonicus TaxID=307972 RepID=A0A2G8JCZ4_STIJA|nr:hypothetical protein BSL78_29568 [Apostichopus japonicus]PIK53381.1 hypothetical protein BSL78_09743 [Apostichopus japonicus]
MTALRHARLLRQTGRPHQQRASQDFQAHGLNITAQTNLKSTNFLDTTMDLESGTHKPYRKPNDEPLYIHVKSNHPPTITKHIPTAIEKRIRELSSNERVFSMAAPPYNAALKKSGYERTITYDDGGAPTTLKKKRKNRQRKTTWFNPPFSRNVETNVGSQFLKLIDRHFPRGCKLRKIFNRNTMKVSYSCMKNMDSIIKSHNARIMRQNNTTTNATKTCNCRDKGACPCVESA